MSCNFEQKPAAFVSGAGDAPRGAIAERFVLEGRIVCVVSRSGAKFPLLLEVIHTGGGKAIALGTDARKEAEAIVLKMGAVQKDTRECIGANADAAQLDTLTKNSASYFNTRLGHIKAVMPRSSLQTRVNAR